MSVQRSMTGACCAVLLGAAAAAGQTTPAGAPPASGPSSDTLSLLLQEVRQLRQVVEQTTLLQVKVQITLQRLTLQEQQVRLLADQAAQLESGAANTAAELERVRTELLEVEERLPREQDANNRRGLADQRTALREAIERETQQDQDLRRRSAEVGQALGTERSRLDELHRALDGLERLVENAARRAPGRGPEAGQPR
jgi:chromosome segregation ATPase